MPYRDKQKRRNFQKTWVSNRRASWFCDKTCSRCGSTDRLELDHINPNTKIDHKIWSWSTTRMLAELAKCQILCHTCHLDKTKSQVLHRDIHGTPGMYSRGCRCLLCRTDVAERKMNWRIKKWQMLVPPRRFELLSCRLKI